MISTLSTLLKCAAVCVLSAAVAFVAGYVFGGRHAMQSAELAAAEAEKVQLQNVAEINEAYIEVLNAENVKKRQILDDFSDFRLAYERLRDELAAVRNDTCAASDYARARDELFAECAKELGDVARAADEHAGDAQMIYNAWQAIYLKQKAIK